MTDNGPSFIARRFADFVREPYSHVRIAYRAPQQLGLLERFHQTLKTEEVYWRLYENPQHARACLTEFHVRYNTMRPHWALVPEEAGDPLVPADVYVGGRTTKIPRWQDWARAAREAGDVAGGGGMRWPSSQEFHRHRAVEQGPRCRPLHARLASICMVKAFDSCCPRNPATRPGRSIPLEPHPKIPSVRLKVGCPRSTG